MPDSAQWLLPLVTTVLFYGLAQALTKQFMSDMSAGAFIVLDVLVKAVLCAGLFMGWGTVNPFDPAASRFVWLSLLGNGINGLAWLFYFKALEKGSVSIVGTITAAYPVVTVILAWAFLGEHLTLLQALGVALVIGAGALLTYQKDGNTLMAGDRRWLYQAGAVFFLWGLASAIFKAAFNAPGADTISFFVHNAVMFTMLLLPYGLREVRGQGLGARNAVLLALVPVGFFCIGDLTLFRAIELGPASIVTPLSGMYPVITLLYAWPVLKEKVTRQQGMAIGLSLLAIMFISLT